MHISVKPSTWVIHGLLCSIHLCLSTYACIFGHSVKAIPFILTVIEPSNGLEENNFANSQGVFTSKLFCCISAYSWEAKHFVPGLTTLVHTTILPALLQWNQAPSKSIGIFIYLSMYLFVFPSRIFFKCQR